MFLARQVIAAPDQCFPYSKLIWVFSRYNDIAAPVRHACVQSTLHFLLNHPELHADITKELKARQHDLDENTR